MIEGRFEIVEPLARGGMGAVYKARQLPLDRICAVKVLRVSYDPEADPLFQRRFFLEASVAAKLTHPNTVRIFDYGQTADGIYFIAMEYLEGRTLFRFLREEGPLDETLACHIAKQICRSLREAHEHGVVHRDLKPGNVLIVERPDERCAVKVLDFGLVKDTSPERTQVTKVGLRMGSPKYMAPEQAKGETITPATDIYSLGVLLYEMLTGKPPFDKKQPTLTAMAQVHDPVPPLASMRPGLSLLPGIEDIVLRCLQKDPARRFPSMQALLDALKAVIADETGENARPSFIPSPAEVALPTEAPSVPPPPSTRPAPVSPPSAPPPVAMPAPMSRSVVPARTSRRASRASRRGSRAAWYAVLIGAALGVCVAAVATRVTPFAGDAVGAPAREGEGEIVAAQTISPPPEPAIARVRLESEPPGATVTDGLRRVCESTPCEAPRDALLGRTLVFDRPGHYASLAEVAPGTDRLLVKLGPVATPKPAPSPAPALPSASDPYKPMPY